MADAFEGILGQPQVREFLRATVKSGRVSHAYLFLGPAGSSKTAAAFALAQAVICEQSDCGSCEACRRVHRRKHPDVRYYAPEGAQGYLVEQVRDIVSDVSLAPIQAAKKVYILDRVDRLGIAAANAFLKTLEEPPEDVVLILLGRTRESVLPTILSRCQVVPFRHIPDGEAAGIVSQNTGVSPEKARMAVQACDGSIEEAIRFCGSNESWAFRKSVLEACATLRHADDWDVLQLSQKLLTDAKAPLDDVRAELEADLAENADFLAKSAIRQIEARNKRALSAKTLQALHRITAITRSWLRDVLMVCAGTPELVINADALGSIEEAAKIANVAGVSQAVRACDRADEAIKYNVSPQTCIDGMLLEIQSLIYSRSGVSRPSRR